MAVYTVIVDGACKANGEHVQVGILRDGSRIRTVRLSRAELLDTDIDRDDLLVAFMRGAIRAANATNSAQMKNAVEAASWTV